MSDAFSNNEHTVLYELRAGVATITLNRPHAYNAFNTPMHHALRQALDAAKHDAGVRCVVITGAGKAFCSGQDIKDIALEGPSLLGQTVREHYSPLARAVRGMPQPIIAAVNGVAAGAGLGLALACDLRIAVESARFVAAFANIGLVPDTGVSYFLPRLIGHARALELCLTGGTLDAPTAYRYGMVNQVVEAANFEAATRELAERLARGPSLALSLTKRAFDLSFDKTLEQMLEHEAQSQQVAGESAEYREGVRAFREKRSPQFVVNERSEDYNG